MKETANFFNDTGAKLAEEGYHNEAVIYLKKGLQMEPYNHLLWFNLGLSYRAMHKYHEAASAFHEALKCNPYDADTWDSLALLLYEIGENETAKHSYNNALTIAPHNGRIWNNYGSLLFSESEFKEARRAFESAVTLAPELENALLNLRDTYLELGEIELVKKCDAIIETKKRSSKTK